MSRVMIFTCLVCCRRSTKSDKFFYCEIFSILYILVNLNLKVDAIIIQMSLSLITITHVLQNCCYRSKTNLSVPWTSKKITLLKENVFIIQLYLIKIFWVSTSKSTTIYRLTIYWRICGRVTTELHTSRFWNTV